MRAEGRGSSDAASVGAGVRHPLDGLSRRGWAAAVAFTFVASALVVWILGRLEPVGASLESLARAGTPAAAKRVLDTWGTAHSFRRAAFSIGLDYLLISLYVPLLMLACLRTRTRGWRIVGVTLAWLQLATAAFDVLENQGMIRVIEGGRRNTGVQGRWLGVTRFAYDARWTLVALAVAFVLARAVAWLLSRRYRSTPPVRVRVPPGDAQDRRRRLAALAVLVSAALVGIAFFVKPVEPGPTLVRMVHSTGGAPEAIVKGWKVYGSIRAAYLAGLIPLALLCAAAAAALVATWGGPSVAVRRAGAALAAAQALVVAGGLLLAAALWRTIVEAAHAPSSMARVAVVGDIALGLAVAFGVVFAVLPWAWRWWLDLREDGSPYPTPEGDRHNFPSPKDRFVRWARGVPFEPELPPSTVAVGRPELRGVCFSGGGIRSAAYNLGALQALQEEGELDQTDFLSAVSGGSYIAGAFAVARRFSDPDLLARQPAFARGSPEERYLRNRTNYLAPRAGGKWYLLWRLLRGLLLNLAIIGAVLYLVGFAIGAMFHPSIVCHRAGETALTPSCARLAPGQAIWVFHAPGWNTALVWAFVSLAAVSLLLGAMDLVTPRRPGEARWLEAWSGRLANASVFGLVVFLVLPRLIVLVRNHRFVVPHHPAWTIGGVGGFLVSILSAVIVELRAGRASAPGSTTAGALATKARSLAARAGPRLRSAFTTFVGGLVGPLAVLLAFVQFVVLGSRGPTTITAWALIVSGMFVVAIWEFGDLTSWSAHPFYRRRLSYAFDVRRTGSARDAQAEQVPFAVRLEDLPPEHEPAKPEVIVCAAANISDQGAEPPGRPVTSWVFTPRAVGGQLCGVMRTSTYREAIGTQEEKITLAAAVSVSGAAISPSMGKLTKRSLTFLMALANVRLGVWLPTPRAIGRWHQRGGTGTTPFRPRPHYLLRELRGSSSFLDRFVYVTDGGHYENLGLVELLRQGCMDVYCFDASGDHVDTFRTIGQAVALARSDLRIEIDIDPRVMTPGEDGFAPTDHVVARFRFAAHAKAAPDAPPSTWPGRLVFAKAAVMADAPWDVLAYKQADPLFPTHSTLDQLYTDEKFESYRALGHFTARRSIDTMRAERAKTGRAARDVRSTD